MATRVVDQNSPHHLRCHSEEMRSTLPVDSVLVNYAQVGFIDQRSCLECVALALAPQISAGDTMKLVVDQRHQPIQRQLIALPPVNQQLSYILGRGRHLSASG